MAPLNILHVFRAPVGGLFRHVLDLSREQIARGHRVGLIADRDTGGPRADEIFRQIEPSLALGLSRVGMGRQPGPGDFMTVGHVLRRVRQSGADVVHGHGAKGGAYARLLFGARHPLRVYTPHGGSLLFEHNTLAGKVYLNTERLLMPRGDLYLFESAFSSDMFRTKIGTPRGLTCIVHNGVSSTEFEPVAASPDATDLVFIGELRTLKGVDVLIDAVAQLRRAGRNLTATVIGDGPDRDAFHVKSANLGLTAAVRFLPAMPARRGFALGKIMVVPSRFESLPYIVLEAAAAAKPLIATRVGGIPEIFGPLSDALVPPNDAAELAGAITRALDRADAAAGTANTLRDRVRASFTIESMVDGVLNAYQTALGTLREKGRR
jgi:glycosyltransferase involved in cell wall biosynthesis